MGAIANKHHYILENDDETQRLEFQVTIPQYSLEGELEFFEPFNNARVIDLGCGSGLLSRFLKNKYPNIQLDACDRSEVRLEQAQILATNANQNEINFFKSDVESLDCPDNVYDFVIVRYVLEHLENPINALREAYRILRPGGKIHVIDFDGIFVDLHTKNEELTQLISEIENNFPGDLRIGRKIPSMLKAANFQSIDCQVKTMQFRGKDAQLELQNNKLRFQNAFQEFVRILKTETRAQRLVDLYLDESMKEENVLCFNKYIVAAMK